MNENSISALIKNGKLPSEAVERMAGAYAVTENGSLLFGSEEFYALFGTSPRMDAIFCENFIKCAKNGGECFFDYPYENGTKRIFAQCMSMGEKIVALFKDMTDIHSRLLRTQNEYLRAFRMAAKKSGTYVFLYNSLNGTSYVDDAAAADFCTGMTMTDIPYGQAYSGIIAEEYRAEYIRIHEAIMKGGKSSGGIVKLIMPDGKEKIYELTFDAVLDDKGSPTGSAVGVYKPVDSKVLPEEASVSRDEVERQLEMIYALSSEYYSIFFLDLDANKIELVRYADKYRSSVWAADLVHSSGRIDLCRDLYMERFIHPEDREKMSSELTIQNVRKNTCGGRSYSRTYRCLVNDRYEYTQWRFVGTERNGSSRVVLAVKSVDSEVRSRLHRQQELTKALEGARTANRAKSDFLMGMSHDIRTPLNAVLGYAAIARRDPKNSEKVAECLDKMEVSGQHLVHLIDDILDMSRIETGKLTLSNRRFNVAAVCRNAAGIMKNRISEKNQRFLAQIPEDAYISVISDDVKLERILLNIMSNSVKFTRDGGMIHFKVRRLKDEGKRAVFEFTVRDTGIGMSEEFVRRIFEPFSQENASDDNSGTGLGMPISKSFAELMGGDIKISSSRGRGSTVTVTLPFELYVKDDISEENAGENSVDLSVLQGKRALVADDNDINMDITREILHDAGMLTEQASDGAEAVKMLLDSPDGYYDIILMDIRMPVMNGYEAAAAIRRSERPYCANVPIAALSANAFDDDRRAASECGMNDYITKPVSIDECLEKLARLLSEKK